MYFIRLPVYLKCRKGTGGKELAKTQPLIRIHTLSLINYAVRV